ncbi:MAG: TIGR03960 family B12-binding radical SAM protein [Lachnospiraceae bacterium]|nr:TIGR03960 family B12-binding radical SAM protein [Lachnospiraceae bacterium]
MSNKLALSDEILMTIEKPARYIGNEVNMVRKDLNQVDIRFVMCFPDVYEIGMSHLGIQILYDMFNKREDTYCERVYSPWPDLHKIMKEENIPLFALESQDPIKCFDFLGITLQYEMCYTNILQILDLSQIAIYSKDRKEEDPIVIGGGPCTYNPEPLADFFDLFYIGEGEVSYQQLLDLYKEKKAGKLNRKEFLEKAALIPGIYVPSLYEVTYQEDQTIKERVALSENAPEMVTKQLVMDMTEAVYPSKPLVPYIKATQDRVVLEIQRGCIRGCRFCQAGMIYRPVRERNVERLKSLAKEMLDNTGHEEISLSSLSSSDYSELKELVYFLIDEFKEKKINISLPSLRIDAFSLDVMSKVQDIKKSSLTFAPEGGTQRMRNIINKGLTEEIILEGAMKAFQGGWNKVKLYFMLGQPFEEMEDVEGIALLCERIAEEYYTIPKSERNGKVAITASASFFVPKPFTPFQWARMNTGEEFLEKAKTVNAKMKEQLNKKSMKFNWHDSKTSVLEGVFARGDRRLSKLIYAAYQKGCIFDSWSEFFKPEAWDEAISENGIDISFYTTRERKEDEIFPWDFIDIGVTKKFLLNEWKKAEKGEITKNCKAGCSGCGAMKFGGGVCYENKN